MTPPTQCDLVQCWLVLNCYSPEPDWLGGHQTWSVGWCSAQRIKNLMIAGGNHTLIQMTPPYRE